jgi:hypothetical protein
MKAELLTSEISIIFAFALIYSNIAFFYVSVVSNLRLIFTPATTFCSSVTIKNQSPDH